MKQILITRPGLTAEPTETLHLKWGTLKGWTLATPASKAALATYNSIGIHSLGAMQQADTEEQKQALCALIDAIDGPIINDWTGRAMTKDDAKAYVLEYRL